MQLQQFHLSLVIATLMGTSLALLMIVGTCCCSCLRLGCCIATMRPTHVLMPWLEWEFLVMVEIIILLHLPMMLSPFWTLIFWASIVIGLVILFVELLLFLNAIAPYLPKKKIPRPPQKVIHPPPPHRNVKVTSHLSIVKMLVHIRESNPSACTPYSLIKTFD